MPVTIKPSVQGTSTISLEREELVRNSLDDLPSHCKPEDQELIQCGFDFSDESPPDRCNPINGLVCAVMSAYNAHRHLVIRPEDVWRTILVQLRSYIDAHGEELRDKFVSCESKKDLILKYSNRSRKPYDPVVFPRDMRNMLQESVVDPELKEWIVPAFSTTKPDDMISASIAMIASGDRYQSYTCVLRCNLPSITLLGERADWSEILVKLEKLTTFGVEPRIFHDLLRPIMTRFVHSFDEPSSPDTINFWQRAVSTHRHPSGASYYSGWITAFHFWNADGKTFYDPSARPWLNKVPCLEMTEGLYSLVETEHGRELPVKIIDDNEESDTDMVAGSTEFKFTSSRKARGRWTRWLRNFAGGCIR